MEDSGESMVKTALRLAQQGFYIFPIKPDSKVPAIEGWHTKATTEPSQIKKWWKYNPDRNIGIATGPSRLLVVDIDTKNDGIKSWESLLSRKDVDFPDTKTISTPSKGFHLYFSLPDTIELRSTASFLATGVDTRATGGYVVAESSSTLAGSYLPLVDVDVAPSPEWLIAELKRKKTIPSESSLFSSDMSFDVAIDVTGAADYLKAIAPAIQGTGGDAYTYSVACELRDRAISQEKGVELLLEHFNPRCEPPWESDELIVKMQNAYAFATGPAGSKSIDFDPVPQPKKHVHCVADMSLDIPPRDWLIDGRLIAGYVTVTVAPGGVGKSMFTMLEALAVATGKPLTGTIPEKRGAVLIYNTEDPQDEIERRMAAICICHGIDPKSLTNVFYMSGVESPLRFLVRRDGNAVKTKDRDKMEKILTENQIILTVIDPFIRSHGLDENNNGDIDLVVQEMSAMAISTNSAVSIVHHTRKIGNQSSPAGDMDLSRGASSLSSAARIVSTVLSMSDEEAESMGCAETKRNWYFRVDNAKGNMSRPVHKPVWFEKVSVELSNGDHVGTIKLKTMKGAQDYAEIDTDIKARQTLSILAPVLGTGELPLDDIILELSTLVPEHFQGLPLTRRREVMKEMFATAVQNDTYQMSLKGETLKVKGIQKWN